MLVLNTLNSSALNDYECFYLLAYSYVLVARAIYALNIDTNRDVSKLLKTWNNAENWLDVISKSFIW